jgi:H+-translocating NAD(P) transhydrogenase subunit alpha
VILAMLLFLVASALLGYRVISRVPPLLHTPLMSGMNALSGITLLGSLTVFALTAGPSRALAALAMLLAMVNVAGGFWVTERMLRMFQHKNQHDEVVAS